MVKPSEKTEGMLRSVDSISEAMFGRKRSTSIKEDICVACGSAAPPESFTDELSKKEYTISGMCQTCQDKTFGKSDEEPIHPDDPLYDEPAF